jgi:hypothetical protein
VRWIACGNWLMNTLVVALSHKTLYMYVRRLTAIEAPQQAQQGNRPCSKLLDANLSEGRISPLDSLHLCQNDEQLGRWSWLKVERKDTSGTSRMVHSMCHNCGGLKFSVLPVQNFTRENIIAAGCFAHFSLVMVCFHTAQDWKSLIKYCNPRMSTAATVNQCTIHWMPVMTQLWMILNWVTTWSHLGNSFKKK